MKKMLTSLLKPLTLAAALGAAAAAPALAANPIDLRVASFKSGSSWYVYSVTLGELLRKHLPEGSTIDTPPVGGGTANPLLISAGKADLAFGFTVTNVWARKGIVFYEEPLPALRALVGGMDAMYLGMISNTENGPDTLEGYLQEKPDPAVYLLTKGSFGAYSGELALNAIGADEKTVDAAGGSYTYTGFDNVKTSFASGRADLFIQLMTKGQPSFMEISETNPVTFMSLSDKSMEALGEFGWNAGVFPAGVYRGQEKPLLLPLTTTNLIVNESMSTDTAYAITKALCENIDEFRAGHQALANFSCQEGAKAENLGLPLHDGAKKYFQEMGWM